jgi:hypothetical protein
MLLVPSETDKPAVDAAQARKERKTALNKAYRAKNVVHLNAKNKAWRAKNAVHLKDQKKTYRAAKSDDMKADTKVYMKAYRAAKADELKDKKKAYRAENAVHIKDQTKAYRKGYRAEKADELKAYDKAWRAKNADHVKAQNKTWKRHVKGCVECKDWIDWRVGWPHYDNMCYRCYTRKFPDDPKVRIEEIVKAYINSHFEGFIHDHKMPTAHCDCNHLRRIDHRCVVGNTLLCIETDEHHHRNYKKDDEDARYHDVLLPWGGKLCFIRFNPDDEGPPLEERLERLHSEMTQHIGRLERGENSSYLEVWHLYYPAGTPDFYDENTSPVL